MTHDERHDSAGRDRRHDDPPRADDGGGHDGDRHDRDDTALPDLLSAWIDGRLDAADAARLDGALRGSRAARESFREWVALDVLLTTLAERTPADAGAPGPARVATTAGAAVAARPGPRAARRGPAGWAAAVLVLAGLAVTGTVWLRQTGPRPGAVAGGCAAVGRLVDAAVVGATVRPGASLGPGPLRLTRGLIQLEFFSGATLWVEGPADVEIVSAWEARLRSGRVRAHVPPPARGFVVHAPGARLEDLGTSFALNVGADGTAAVHVFDGEVIVQPHAAAGATLGAGDGLVLDRTGHARDDDPAAAAVGPGAFLALDAMAAAADDRRRVRHEAWARWLESARHDPRLVTFYRFDRSDPPGLGGRVRNVAEPPVADRDGAAVGVTWTPGRWPGTDAVAFRRAGGRVRVAIDGDYGAVSLACWARVDAVDREYNSLFLTDGYDPGEPHWQIVSDGSLMFSIAYPPAGAGAGRFNQKYHSRPVFTVDTLGEWHHLAVTYDGTTGEVVQYFDGEMVGREVSPLHAAGRLVRFGPAEIGNWGLPTPGHRHPLRSLNGAIDEFAIHAAVLTAVEVRAMAEAGRVD